MGINQGFEENGFCGSALFTLSLSLSFCACKRVGANEKPMKKEEREKQREQHGDTKSSCSAMVETMEENEEEAQEAEETRRGRQIGEK